MGTDPYRSFGGAGAQQMLRWISAEGRQGDRSAILWQAHKDLPSLPGDSAGTTTLIPLEPHAHSRLSCRMNALEVQSAQHKKSSVFPIP